MPTFTFDAWMTELGETEIRKDNKMNEKLKMFAGMDFQKFKPKESRGGGKCGSKNKDALVSYGYSKMTKGNRSPRLRFGFHLRAIKQLGWMRGDRLSFRVNEDGSVVVFRDAKGYSLTSQTTKASCRMQVQFPIADERLLSAIGFGEGKNVEIANGAIAFDVD